MISTRQLRTAVSAAPRLRDAAYDEIADELVS
jgi:hypothetical protein